MLDNLALAADHQAINTVVPGDATTYADINIVLTAGREPCGAAYIVAIVGIAAVNDDVARIEERCQMDELLVYDCCRHHQPDDARTS